MAHPNSLGTISHQLKIRHLYETFNFSTQCICMWNGKPVFYGFRHLKEKAVLECKKCENFLSSLAAPLARIYIDFLNVSVLSIYGRLYI